MMTLDDGHVTTIAVDPKWHRHKIGTRLLLVLAREAIARGRDEPHARSAHVEPRRAGALPAVRVRPGRRAQELLPRGQRGRARDVGARGRPSRVHRAARRPSSAGFPARPSWRNGAPDAHPRDRDVVRRDRGRGRRGRPHRALVGGVEPGRSPRALRRGRARDREPRPRRARHRGDRRGARRGGRGARARSTRSPRATDPGSRARCSSA